jgi:lysophospholipase L1-like esterase
VATKVKQALRLIGVQITLFILLMIGLDIFLWVAMPIDKYLSGSLTKKFVQTEPGLKSEITYTQIANGLRSLSVRGLERPANTLRILCLGASSTTQITQETKDTWCGILEPNLQKMYPQTHIQTLSYGTGGATIIDDLTWLKRNFDYIKPDVVVTLLGINDITFKGTLKGGPLAPAPSDLWAKVLARCVNVSQICRRIEEINRNLAIRAALRTKKKVIEWHSGHLPTLRQQYKQLRYVGDTVTRPDGIQDFSSILGSMLDFLKSRNTSVIVLGQPTLWKPDMTREEYDRLWFPLYTPEGPVRASTSWLLNEMHRYNDVQKNEAIKYGFAYIDLDTLVPKSTDYYFDDCHFTDIGSKRVAEVVQPAVAKLLSLRHGSEIGVVAK